MTRKTALIWLVVALTNASGFASAASGQELTSPESPGATPAPFIGDEFVLGAVDAPVTVIEYLSVTCAHCAAFDANTFPYVKRAFLDTGRVRLIVRELPTAPVTASAAGFLLARCTGETSYWQTVEAMLKRQSFVLAADGPAEAVARMVEISGLPAGTAQRCLSDETAIERLNARRQSALDAGVDSTPTFIFRSHSAETEGAPDPKNRETGELSREQWERAYRRAAAEPAVARGKRSQTFKPRSP